MCAGGAPILVPGRVFWEVDMKRGWGEGRPHSQSSGSGVTRTKRPLVNMQLLNSASKLKSRNLRNELWFKGLKTVLINLPTKKFPPGPSMHLTWEGSLCLVHYIVKVYTKMSIRLEEREAKGKEKKNVNVNTHTLRHQNISYSLATSPIKSCSYLTVAESIPRSMLLNPLSAPQPKPLSHLSQKCPQSPWRLLKEAANGEWELLGWEG